MGMWPITGSPCWLRKRRFFSYLRDRWWVVLVCIILTVTPVLVYDTVFPEKYRSFAQLYLSGDIQITSANLFAEDRNYIGTQIELLKSPRLQSAAAVKASQGAAGIPPLVDVEVTQPLNTSILQLRATGADPAYTQRYLQALIDEYKNYQQETRQSTSDEVLYSFKQELAKREATLKEVQTNYIEFQRTNSLAVMEEEAKSTALSLASLDQRLQELKLKRDFLTSGINAPAPSLLETNKSPRPTNQVASLTLGLDAGTNNSAGSGDVELKGARVRLSLALGDLAASPSTDIDAILNRHLKQRIDTARHEIATLEDLDRAQKRMDLQECEKQMSIITNTIPSVQAHMLEINERLSESLRFKNDIQREQGYYDHLLSMMQNVDLSKNVQQERASIVQAPVPARPVSRMLPLLILIAAVAGVGLGSGIVFVWHLWDDRFSSVRDVKDQFGEMVLGLVPEIKVPHSRSQEALLKDADPRYAYVESFRHLRSALLLSPNCESRQQTLLITGVSPGEGKTTVAFNLARTLARSGLRVVLVDADVGGAGLHRLLDQAEGPGMFDCLRHEVSVQDVVHPTAIPGLSYVPRGLSREDRDGYFLRPEFGESYERVAPGS